MPTNPYEPPKGETAVGNSSRHSPLFWVVATVCALIVAFPALAGIVIVILAELGLL